MPTNQKEDEKQHSKLVLEGAKLLADQNAG
jgi:hypothetical protein